MIRPSRTRLPEEQIHGTSGVGDVAKRSIGRVSSQVAGVSDNWIGGLLRCRMSLEGTPILGLNLRTLVLSL